MIMIVSEIRAMHLKWLLKMETRGCDALHTSSALARARWLMERRLAISTVDVSSLK